MNLTFGQEVLYLSGGKAYFNETCYFLPVTDSGYVLKGSLTILLRSLIILVGILVILVGSLTILVGSLIILLGYLIILLGYLAQSQLLRGLGSGSDLP